MKIALKKCLLFLIVDIDFDFLSPRYKDNIFGFGKI